MAKLLQTYTPNLIVELHAGVDRADSSIIWSDAAMRAKRIRCFARRMDRLRPRIATTKATIYPTSAIVRRHSNHTLTRRCRLMLAQNCQPAGQEVKTAGLIEKRRGRPVVVNYGADDGPRSVGTGSIGILRLL